MVLALLYLYNRSLSFSCNLLQFLLIIALDVVGLFRVPGSLAEIRQLKAMFDRGMLMPILFFL
jgi:hypothetical protein